MSERDAAAPGELTRAYATFFEKRFEVPTEVGRPNSLLPHSFPSQRRSSPFESTHPWLGALVGSYSIVSGFP